MSFKSLKEIVKKSADTGKEFWEMIADDDVKERQTTKEESFAKMSAMYEAMKKADAAYDKNLVSASKMAGGNSELIQKAAKEGKTICGSFISKVMAKALATGESNACMKRIVAAPTAGSCGVLPAVLISMEEEFGYDSESMLKALYTAAGIGQVIAIRASISGAQGGCQAEIGSASAMAAGAAAYLKGGDAECIAHAAAMALKSLLGLACDPVGGLVEVPCVKRNVIGAVNALTSADMSLAGIRSVIPPDEVIDAMDDIGKSMPVALKETGEGGLAVTPTGIKLAKGIL